MILKFSNLLPLCFSLCLSFSKLDCPWRIFLKGHPLDSAGSESKHKADRCSRGFCLNWPLPQSEPFSQGLCNFFPRRHQSRRIFPPFPTWGSWRSLWARHPCLEVVHPVLQSSKGNRLGIVLLQHILWTRHSPSLKMNQLSAQPPSPYLALFPVRSA